MKKIILPLVATMVLTGCMLKQRPKIFPFPEGQVSVVGNIIYCNGKPFAEVKILDFDMQEAVSEITSLSGGIAIYYYSCDKEVWIYPKRTLSVVYDGKEYFKIDDMKRVWEIFSKEHDAYYEDKRKGRENLQLPTHHAWINYNGRGLDKLDPVWFSGVKISADGKYVYYHKHGWIFDYSRKYLVEYGISK